MDAAAIYSAIEKLGLPVAACAGLFYIVYKQMTAMIVSLNAITATLASITQRLEKIDDKINALTSGANHEN